MDDYYDLLDRQLAELTRRGAHLPRRRLPRPRLGPITLALSTAMAVAVAVVVLVSVHRTRTSPAHSAPTAPASRIDPALAANFRILQLGQPGLPPRLLAHGLALGLAPWLTRSTAVSGTRVWFTPGRSGFCWDAVDRTRVLAPVCLPFSHPATALTAGAGDVFAAGTHVPTSLEAVGILTNRVTSLQLVTPQNQVTPVAIVNGVYVTAFQLSDRLLAHTATGTYPIAVRYGSARPVEIGRPYGTALLLAQINLTPPPGVHDRRRAGVAQVIRSGGNTGVVIVAQGVPANTPHNAYGVWLADGRGGATKFLGFVDQRVTRRGKLETEGQLPADAGDYRRLLIALQTGRRPARPGTIVLEGHFPHITAPARTRTSRARRVTPLGP
jgi:hypothetical protein